VQRKIFEIMGLSPAEVENRFGHLIDAYKFGAPPHAGIAPGFDRLVMRLANEKDIREVIAFPMSARGQTSVMDAPSELDEKQLEELHIKIARE
ncbi:MAG: aspartate--tRNA ligase, partial [Candidatus Yanofskybacteria bacterium]|nr:aspartate--tRNA ligase [Candidatus Yanofskybacteria bacterium]